ncbi:MAG: phosphoglucosamine mutase, partial [Proteobacteria bacterium]|nr:phosphoglucosamine mutase [Pseudomonadota bacterium]
MTGGVYRIDDAGQNYIDFLLGKVPKKFCQGMKIVIDCSNGATYKVAPELFVRLGAEVETLFNDPDGKNINENCGSENTSKLRKSVLKKRADIGLAFDGDGDRLIAVDEKGNVITGDQILAVCAKSMKKKDQLKSNTVVSTVMSNMGLGIALEDTGIKHIKAKVGDRYVLESMIHSGAVLGGEDSGHMIFLDHQTTGDGILTALKLIEALKDESKPLSELVKIMDVFPQVLINVEVKNKPEIATIPQITETINAVEKNLAEKGRVLVRYSGTQPLCRVMVEGPTQELTEKYCQEIADTIKEQIG